MGEVLILIGFITFLICVFVALFSAGENNSIMISSLIGLGLSVILITIGGAVMIRTPEPYLVSECIEYVSDKETFYRVRLFNQDTEKIVIIYIYPEQLDKYKFEVGGTVELSETQFKRFMKQEE